MKPLPRTVDGSMEGHFSTPTFYKFPSLCPDLGRWRCTRRPSLRWGASRPFCCSWTPTKIKPDDYPQLDEGVRQLVDSRWTWRLPWVPTTLESQEVNLGVAPGDVSVQSCRGWSPVQLLVRTRLGEVIQSAPDRVQMPAEDRRFDIHQNLTLSVIVFSLSILISLLFIWSQAKWYKSQSFCM